MIMTDDDCLDAAAASGGWIQGSKGRPAQGIERLLALSLRAPYYLPLMLPRLPACLPPAHFVSLQETWKFDKSNKLVGT